MAQYTYNEAQVEDALKNFGKVMEEVYALPGITSAMKELNSIPEVVKHTFWQHYWKTNKSRLLGWGKFSKVVTKDTAGATTTEPLGFRIPYKDEVWLKRQLRADVDWVGYFTEATSFIRQQTAPLAGFFRSVNKLATTIQGGDFAAKLALYLVIFDQVMVYTVQCLTCAAFSSNGARFWTAAKQFVREFVMDFVKGMGRTPADIEKSFGTASIDTWVRKLAPFMIACGVRLRGIDRAVPEFSYWESGQEEREQEVEEE